MFRSLIRGLTKATKWLPSLHNWLAGRRQYRNSAEVVASMKRGEIDLSQAMDEVRKYAAPTVQKRMQPGWYTPSSKRFPASKLDELAREFNVV